MIKPSKILISAFSCALLCSASSLRAGENSPFGTDFIQTFSGTELPFTQNNSELNIEIRPKIGDLLDEPFIRLPIELEYGFTPKLEGSIGVIPFLENPFHGDRASSDGYFTFGLKQRIDALENDRLAVSVGLNGRLPLDTIPSDWQRDQYDSYTPFFVAAYEIDKSGEWTVFSNVAYELLDKDNNQMPYLIEAPNSLARFTTGFIHHPPGDLRYGLRFLYITEDFDGGTNDGLKIIPSITWYPPDDTWFFRSIAGHFELTLDVEYAMEKLPEQAEESDIGINFKVRWNLLRKNERAKEAVIR
ncbi:hypothetical protein [Pelagicoccus albus]|uniref:MetA-pathway of phenol degradation n=1 Tax=Pelagicoccus albus TaxID=415222 RepID=A0A7X1B5Q1_9BACT|nr:hypothetical protein [Pelagicoccus albus]MBC2606134.1 hypothetical protein [Pelagicoccus albus]